MNKKTIMMLYQKNRINQKVIFKNLMLTIINNNNNNSKTKLIQNLIK